MYCTHYAGWHGGNKKYALDPMMEIILGRSFSLSFIYDESVAARAW